MKQRIERLRQIVALQKRIHDLALWRLGALERERVALEDDRLDLFRSLADGPLAFGPPAALGVRRIRNVEKRIAALEADHEAQKRLALNEGARAKMADRAAETAKAAYRERNERKALADLVERSLRKPDSSST